MSSNMWVCRLCTPEELLNTVPLLSPMRDSGGLHRAWEGVGVGLRPGPWTLRDDPSHLRSVQASC